MITYDLPEGSRPMPHVNPSRIPKCPSVLPAGFTCARGYALMFYAAGDSRPSFKCGGDPSHPGCGHIWKP